MNLMKKNDDLLIAGSKPAGKKAKKKKVQAAPGIAPVIGNRALETDAAELLIANKELAFQNEEKEKWAAELAVANTELAFQNREKEKRAAELLIIIEELKNSKDNVRMLNDELEQKVIERTVQLQSANKELESFSYSVSHDLRAPLRAINGYAKMLKRDYGPALESEANRLMDTIMNNAKKMGQLIDELLNFSRLGRKELIMGQVQMQSMVTNICEELKIEKGNETITFYINNLLPAGGDTSTIKQVWLNLVSNAIKYSKLIEKPVIQIGSEIKGDEIIYHIKDSGAGFDMRYADKLFGVFQRLHSDEEFEGIGVGLAIVHRIITKHGGRVWAQGKVNEGATFYFTLKK
jgi:light-regulated signal transduction histidine kinase (bacteriophytochrome)